MNYIIITDPEGVYKGFVEGKGSGDGAGGHIQNDWGDGSGDGYGWIQGMGCVLPTTISKEIQ